MVKGKEKGNEFERFVAKSFDEWWGVKPHTFWRTPLSGGWLEPGDISVQHNQNQGIIWFPFLTECKSYKSFDFLQVLTRLTTTQVFNWWKQVTEEQDAAIAAGKPPGEAKRLLMIKINNKGVFTVFSDPDLVFLSEMKGNTIDFMVNDETLHLCLWSTFSRVYNKTKLEELYRSK